MRRAIALGGGGTKGSYEAGVWKAIEELGIDYQIVTGTSIGSITGALMVMKDYQRACDIWENMEITDIMVDGLNLTSTIEGMYNQREAFGPFLKKYVKNKGADISPFKRFVQEQIDEEKIRESDIDFGLVTVQFSSLTPMELTKEEIPQGYLRDYILASSAIFPLFPMHKIGDELYVDGCYYDNLPIDLALKMGADEVIAVDLDTSPEHPNYVNKPYVKYIIPSKPLGTMMNFEKEVLEANRKLGYYDAMKVFGKMDGYEYVFYQEDLNQYQKEIQDFVSRVARTESYLTEGTFRKFVKPGDSNRLCGNIEEHIKKEVYTKQDYFVGAAEICGEIFELPKEEPWYLAEFTENLLAQFTPEEEVDLSIFNGLGPVEMAAKMAEIKLKKDSKYMVSAIYYGFIRGKIDMVEQLALLTFAPYELAAALFLLIMGKEYRN